MNLKPEPVSGRENFPFSGRHRETSAMLASGAIPMIHFRIPGGKEMNMMYPGTSGKVHFFRKPALQRWLLFRMVFRGKCPLFAPPPSGEFQGIFSGAPGSAVSPSF
ncbi:hypothetical protein DMI71_00475 [Akkermansia muciniphila]|jgi:hypothetical protein|nr:hypothetical protein DMI71_00475 [Akkermansia muciniphila]QHV57191.1 hypothetical protein DMI73_00480 [Akkermansia muciniphila]QHV60554.1 hypothetical protein DMI74_06185 [Akkermansia muciniphila]